MHGHICDLHWVMLQCTYLLYTIFIPYIESHNYVNTKNLTSCVFHNDPGSHRTHDYKNLTSCVFQNDPGRHRTQVSTGHISDQATSQ